MEWTGGKTARRDRPRAGPEKAWLPECNSIRSRPGWAEPEVYFRIVHTPLQGHNGSPAATYRDQTVEIALGPKGAFENGNIGALTRRVSTDRVVSAASPSRGNPKPPKMAKMPRVVELLRKAIEWQALLESGDAANQTDIACKEGITRARVTQIMGMLHLAPEIHRSILAIPATVRRQNITERALRPITQIEDRGQQAAMFDALMGRA